MRLHSAGPSPWLVAAPAVVMMVVASSMPARAAPPPGDAPDRAAVFAATDSVLDLDRLVSAVIERNPSFAATAAAVREADARAEQAGALEDPMIELGVAPRSLGANSDADAGWRASIAQPLPLFGQRGLRRRAAAAGAEIARSDLEVARLDLVRATRDAFFADYHDEQVQSIALQTLEWMRRARAAALARYAAGTGQQQDVLAADVEIAMLDHQAVMAARNRRLVEARLRALLHLDPLAPLPPPPDTLALPDRDDARLLVMRSNERTRPELRGAEAAIEAQRLKLALARRGRLPQTRLGFGYDRTMAEPAYRPMVTLTLEAPWAPGRRAAEEREAQAALEGAAARRDATRDELLRRITEASTRLEESLHELEVLRGGLLPAAERSQAAARASYEAGRGGFDTLIRAERDVLGARLEYHRTLAAVNQAHADLERALGGPGPAGKEQP